MSLPVVNHEDYFAKIGDDHKFPINKFGELANYLIRKKIISVVITFVDFFIIYFKPFHIRPKSRHKYKGDIYHLLKNKLEPKRTL